MSAQPDTTADDDDTDAMTGDDALENADDPATEDPGDPSSTEVR